MRIGLTPAVKPARSRRFFEKAAIEQQLRDLDRIQRRAFTQIVRNAPECEAVVDCWVDTDTADECREVACALNRGDISAVFALIDNEKAGRFAQDFARFIIRQGVFKLDVHRFGMADKCRHANTCGCEFYLRVDDFFRFRRHLPLFFREAVFHEDVDMRDDVKCDLLGELFRFRRVCDVDLLGLVPELVHRRFAGAGGRLIS